MMLPIPGKERVRAKTGDSELRDGKGRGGGGHFQAEEQFSSLQEQGGGEGTPLETRGKEGRGERVSI